MTVMKRGFYFFLAVVVFVMLVCSGCNRVGGYRALVDEELATGVKYDTLIHGIRFGMNKREFFAHCWELNKQGVFKEGAFNTSVFYEIVKHGKRYNVNFYPKFVAGRITELPLEYTYAAFAPWNSEYTMDRLQSEVVGMYVEKYGKYDLQVPSEKGGDKTAYVWVHGNQRISIYKDDFRNSVIVLYFDLSSQLQHGHQLESK